MWRRFEEDGLNVEKIKEDIDSVLVKTLLVADDAIPNQPNSFEVYGFDIMLDQHLTPWLIEVNSSPSLACDFKVDVDVKHQMMQDTIRLVNPLPFDREALREAVEDRMTTIETERKRPYATPSAMSRAAVENASSSTPTRMTQSQKNTNHHLNRILRGKLPRVPCSGVVAPEHLGGYKQIAPWSLVYDKALKMKRRCLFSHRKKST
jgi:hypothetical protein